MKKPPAPETWPSRADAGERIGRSERSIRRLEHAGELDARPDKSGVYRVDPQSLERFMADQASRGKNLEPARDNAEQRGGHSIAKQVDGDAGDAVGEGINGPTAAAVFELFNAGKRRREVVVILKLHPDIVEALYEKWVRLGGGLMLDEEHLARLSRLNLVVLTRSALVGALERLVPDAWSYRKLRYACACGCGETVQLEATAFASAVQKGAFAGWHLSTHAEKMKKRKPEDESDE